MVCKIFSMFCMTWRKFAEKDIKLQSKSNPASTAVCGLATKEVERPVMCGSLSADLAELACTLWKNIDL